MDTTGWTFAGIISLDCGSGKEFQPKSNAKPMNAWRHMD